MEIGDTVKKNNTVKISGELKNSTFMTNNKTRLLIDAMFISFSILFFIIIGLSTGLLDTPHKEQCNMNYFIRNISEKYPMGHGFVVSTQDCFVLTRECIRMGGMWLNPENTSCGFYKDVN